MYPISTNNLSAFECTVVICTRNRPIHLRRCIEELQKQIFRSFEILVVDNSPSPSEACHIAASFGARYLLCPTIGLSRARNAGMRACSTEFVAFIDDDAVPEADWLVKLLAQFSSAEIVAVTGQIVLEGWQIPPSLNSRGYVRVDKSTPYWFEMTNFGGVGSGSNMAFRRNALDFWQGFNECLGRGKPMNAWEDDYAFFTLVDRGFSIVYAPDAQVRHPAPSEKDQLYSTLHLISVSSAYITLLACEHPTHILQIVRFLLDAALRTPRTWRNRTPKAFNSCAPTWLVYSALLLGPFIYFYMRLTNAFKFETKTLIQALDSQVPNEP